MGAPHLVHLPESPVVPRSPCSRGRQARGGGLGRRMVEACFPLADPGLVMVRVPNRDCVPALERLGAGLHCTKYCGRATRRGWGPASLYTEILHLKNENLI